MKKHIFTTMLMLLAVLALGSCNDNKNDRLTVYYNITLTDDMAQVADLALTYKGDDGKSVTDTITSKIWNKAVHMDTFPCQFGLVDYTFIPKPGSQLKKASYELEAVFSAYARGGDKLGLDYYLVNPFTLKSDKVATLLDMANDHGDQSILVTAIKENGRIKFTGKGKLDVNVHAAVPRWPDSDLLEAEKQKAAKQAEQSASESTEQ